ncbi:hypothetical protein CASFOL_036553 [Castilleja foliolosa]|uniref:Uncharacterized protein n=1 Tax=Castilleja foliolosa TaxID=1961234 RepID=A0ABD3BXG1_9LAMI
MLNEGLKSLNESADVSIDVLEFKQSRDARVEAKEDPDATEDSSSFADTYSGNENNSGLSGAEVESQFFEDSDLAPPFDGFSSVFPIRKKKMTAHWRNFIQPLMWRCKWTELRIKELESQLSKYANDISINNRGKHVVLDEMTVEQSGSKSLPFTTHLSHRKKPMKRRKRKRTELTTDIASYMSNHILFSERENKKSDLDGAPTSENLDNSDQQATDHEFGIHDDCVFPEDNNSNNSLEHVLRKIDMVHARVNKMKDKLNTVMTNNASRFCSSENLSQLVAGDVQTSSVHSPTLSACNGDNVSVGGLYTSPQHITDYDLGDFIMHDNDVSIFGEAIDIPDIIESTVGLLSSIDVTQHHAQAGDSSERIVDNMVIQNEAAEIEGSVLMKPQDADNSGEEEESNNNGMLLALEPDKVDAKDVETTEPSILNMIIA